MKWRCQGPLWLTSQAKFLRHSRPTMPVGPRKVGGPNTAFLRQYGLDKMSHSMDWFTAFMPLTLDANLENPGIANVKGGKTTRFAVSNWTAYSNAKAMLNNDGEEGNIFFQKAPAIHQQGHCCDAWRVHHRWTGPESAAHTEDAASVEAADTWQQQDRIEHQDGIPTEALILPAFLCMPGSFDNSST